MSNAKRRANATGRSRATSEHWTKMLRHTMEEPAWRALSTTAQALYPWLKLEWHGPDANNNGQIRFSIRQASQMLGVASNTAAEAFRDLQRKGFIIQTERACLGLEGEAKSPAYEITELRMVGADGDGRKLYRDWSEDTEFPVQMSVANNPTGRNGGGLQPRRKSPTAKTKPHLKNEDGPISKIETKSDFPSQKLRRPISKTKTVLPFPAPAPSQKLRHPYPTIPLRAGGAADEHA